MNIKSFVTNKLGVDKAIFYKLLGQGLSVFSMIDTHKSPFFRLLGNICDRQKEVRDSYMKEISSYLWRIALD